MYDETISACSYEGCKKIYNNMTEEWIRLPELYDYYTASAKTLKEFRLSHGLCPEHFKELMAEMNELEEIVNEE